MGRIISPSITLKKDMVLESPGCLIIGIAWSSNGGKEADVRIQIGNL